MQYRLIERIGSGGMAEVFRASACGPHGFARTVAVKRILPHLASNPEFVRMFVDEARISARLVHPNVVQIFAFAEASGAPFLVMEHVDGVDLGAILRRLAQTGRMLPPPVVAEIARQCCAALDYAHRLTGAEGAPLGIVHRDVTPSNVMIRWDGVVKLLDFGIARAARDVRQSETAAGTMKGKIGYVAPEQISKGITDARADLFALGAVMHEGLTGKRLFSEGTDLATLMSVLEKAIDPPSRSNPAVTGTLDSVVLRALRRDPAQRFGTAAEMGTALDGYLRRVRGGGPGRLRAFMAELGQRAAAAPGATPPPLPADAAPPRPDTIALDELEVVYEIDGAPAPAAPSAAAPPSPPNAAPRSAIARRMAAVAARVPARRPRARILVMAAAAAALALVAGRGLGSSARARALAGVVVPTTTAAVAAPAPAPEDARVAVVLDSSPQGATVARAPGGAALGETPLLLDLPRGRTPLSFWLRKPGYEAVSYKLIPSGDRSTVVKLKRAGHGGRMAAADPAGGAAGDGE